MKPKASDKQVDKHIHINQTQLKFKQLIRREVYPIAALALLGAFCFKFKTQLENLLPSSNLITPSVERSISKKLAGLLTQQYKYGKIPVSDDIIDIQLVG